MNGIKPDYIGLVIIRGKNILKIFITGIFCLAIWIFIGYTTFVNLLAGDDTSYNTHNTIEKENFGADINPTGNPIGGGKGYKKFVTEIHYKVKTYKELIRAIKKSKPFRTIYIDDNAVIDMTGKERISIPVGVTLASGRGRNNSQGALLFSDKLDTCPLLSTGGPKVRITGLRLRGPDPERRTEQMQQLYKEGKYYSIPNSDGIMSLYSELEVDNCELWGWSHASISLKKGASAYIHHNHIHHNQRQGLGYGICLNEADAVIEANLFDWCRHAIAGTGMPGTSYEACYNIVLENANSYSFDMHGGADRKDGTDIAGDWIHIHHNTFRATHKSAIIINGRPRQRAEIHHNWFLHPDKEMAIKQTNGEGNMNIYKNVYTSDKILK